MGIGAGLRWVGNICGGYNYKCDPAFALRLKRSGKNGLHKASLSQLAKTENKMMSMLSMRTMCSS